MPNIELKRALINRRLHLFPARADGSLRLFGVIEGIKIGDKASQRSVFSVRDVVSLATDVKTAHSSRERRVAFEIGEHIVRRLPLDDAKEGFRILRKAVRNSRDAELRARVPGGIRRWFNGKWYRFRHQHQYELRRWASKLVDETVGLRWRVRNFLMFFRKRKSLRSGQDAIALAWAVRHVPNDLGNGTIKFVRERYGALVASWFSEGYRAFWRRHSLLLDERNSYLAYVGLSGLAIEAQHGPITGTELEISNALEYGLCNLNSVPDWFVAAAKDNRAVFLDVAQRVISNEFDAGAADNPEPTSGFRKIVDADPLLRDDIAPFLLAQLQAGRALSPANLQLSLRVTGVAETVDAEVAAIFFEIGFKASFTSFDFVTSWLWLDALFLVDSTKDWDCLIELVGDDWVAAAAGLFRTFLGREVRYGGRSPERSDDRDDLSSNSAVLAQLIRAAYLVWPPSSDPFHEDAYSPGAAERATDRRRYYVAALARSGKDAAKEFDWLIVHPQLKDYAESFKYDKDQMVRSMARRPSFDASQATIFLNGFSKAPETIVEFRSLVRRHLRALLHKLHLSDDDESYVFRRGGATEDDLRNWLAGRMREMGDRHYSVIREQEVGKENRPDLRVHARKHDLGNVSIEIKLADEDHWPGRVLKDKLQTQLADQYMHEFGSHSGIYLLANAAKPRIAEYDRKGVLLRKAFSKKIGSKSYDFASLVTLLEEDAKLLCSDDRFVEVMAVDLSER